MSKSIHERVRATLEAQERKAKRQVSLTADARRTRLENRELRDEQLLDAVYSDDYRCAAPRNARERKIVETAALRRDLEGL